MNFLFEYPEIIYKGMKGVLPYFKIIGNSLLSIIILYKIFLLKDNIDDPNKNIDFSINFIFFLFISTFAINSAEYIIKFLYNFFTNLICLFDFKYDELSIKFADTIKDSIDDKMFINQLKDYIVFLIYWISLYFVKFIFLIAGIFLLINIIYYLYFAPLFIVVYYFGNTGKQKATNFFSKLFCFFFSLALYKVLFDTLTEVALLFFKEYNGGIINNTLEKIWILVMFPVFAYIFVAILPKKIQDLF